MSDTHGVDSEVGALRTVLVHRPGPELQRITPRTRDRLLFDTVPWLGRAQHEHDAFTQRLRDAGVEVSYVTELLQDALEYQLARDEAIASALADAGLGEELRAQVRDRLDPLAPEDLGRVLIAGLTPGDLPGGRGLVFQLMDRHDFVIDPLPNLVFARDGSFWVGDRVAVSSPADPRRRREAALLQVIYRHHPRFAGTKQLYGPELERLAGADVLLLAPGVLAVGVGERTSAAGAERLARRVLDASLAHTVLAIPVDQRDGSGYLDTLCTVIDTDTVLMHPAVAFTLTAHLITAQPDGARVSRPRPFLEAAAEAMGIERLHVIDTGLDPGPGRRGQWDDGGNALALGRRLVMCHERTTETITRLEACGVTVIQVPGSELGSSRGGPRGMCCPIGRDPAAEGVSTGAGDGSSADPGQAAATVPDGGAVPGAVAERAGGYAGAAGGAPSCPAGSEPAERQPELAPA